MPKLTAGNKKAERLTGEIFALFWMRSCFRFLRSPVFKELQIKWASVARKISGGAI